MPSYEMPAEWHRVCDHEELWDKLAGLVYRVMDYENRWGWPNMVRDGYRRALWALIGLSGVWELVVVNNKGMFTYDSLLATLLTY